MTELWMTKCCALIEVKNLSDSKTSEEAFLSIYDQLATKGAQKVYEVPEMVDSTTGAITPAYMKKGKDSVGFSRPFIMFTSFVGDDAHKVAGHPNQQRLTNYGEEFTKFILENDLGTVTETEPGQNFTGNFVKVYIWKPDYARVKQVYKDILEQEKQEGLAILAQEVR